MMFSIARMGGLFVVIFMIMGLMSSPSTGLEAPQAQTDDLGPSFDQGLRDRIEREGEVDVFISLDVPAAAAIAASPSDLDTLRRSVAASQDALLTPMADAGAMVADGAGSAAFEIRRRFDAVPAIAATVRTQSALDEIMASSLVIGVQADTGGTGTLGNSVPFIGADVRHANGNDGEGVTVAVLDTGADLDHPDLIDDILANQACFGDNDGAIDGSGFCPNGSDRQTGAGAAEDDAGHGTHVTGIVTSAGTVSAPGSAPGAEIVSIKITDNCTFSGCFSFFSEIVAAWNWIINNNDTLGIEVMNMSFGTNMQFAGNCDASFPAAATAITTLRSLGITPFASAGNNGGTQMGAPACLSQVISVGATDNADNVAGLSDSNATTDIFAPGLNIVSLGIGGGTATASGTSMASPHAAGCAALLIEAGDATTPAAIETRLETSPFQVTDPAGLTFPRIDCRPDDDDPPTADIGGPYTTDEGVDVVLDASGSSDPEGGVIDIAWDLDNDGSFDDATGPSTTFTDVGQDGVFIVAIQVTDPGGQTAVAQTTVTVNNVAPQVSVGSTSPVDENTSIAISGTVTDPGWEEALTATIDWGDGSPSQALPGVLENDRPDATLTFDAVHVYGDNGTFAAEICGFDDDTSTCVTVDLIVDNVDPTATIDTSDTVAFPGGPAPVTTVGEPLDVEGTSTDPGSDDLILSWDWDDGPPAPDVTTEYRNNPAFPDPFPSPEINPRNVTDQQSHVFDQACLYEVVFTAVDDDGGAAADSITVVILGDEDRTRSAGYWYQQFRQGRSQKIDNVTLECYLAIIDTISSVFSEVRGAASIGQARDVLTGKVAATSPAYKLDRQLLAAWLNYVNGVVAYDQPIDTDRDGTVDTPFGDVIAFAEATRLDPTATRDQLLAQKDILERFNTRS